MSRALHIRKLGDAHTPAVPIQRREPVFADETTALERHGPDRIKACSVYVWQNMIAELVYASRRSPGVLQVAILIGQVIESSLGSAIEVRGYVGLDRYDGLQDFSQDLADSWDLTMNRIGRLSEGYFPLGWCLIADDALDESLHERERLTHRTFFNLPFQVMLRMNPDTEEVSIFGFDESGLLIQTGFSVVHRRDGAT